MISRLIGTAVMSLFGALWLWLALHETSLQSQLPWAAPAGFALAAVLIVLAFLQARNLGGTPRRIDRRMVWLGIGGEVIALIAAANLLPALHRTDLLMPVVAIIVGLHFLPLTKGFGVPVYLWTGIGLTIVGVAGVVLTGSARYLEVGVGAAMVLWLTSAALIASGRRVSAAAST